MRYYIAPIGIVVCLILIPYQLYDNHQRVKAFEERCIAAGGVPDTSRQMICHSKSSVLFVR